MKRRGDVACFASPLPAGGSAGVAGCTMDEGREGRRNEPVELLSLETPPLDAREERETGTPEKEPRIEEEVKTAVRAPPVPLAPHAQSGAKSATRWVEDAPKMYQAACPHSALVSYQH